MSDTETPDMFNPYVLLRSCAGAGMIELRGGHCSNMTFQINSGSPYQAAYNEAFEIAIVMRVPLWIEKTYNSMTCAYNPRLEK